MEIRLPARQDSFSTTAFVSRSHCMPLSPGRNVIRQDVELSHTMSRVHEALAPCVAHDSSSATGNESACIAFYQLMLPNLEMDSR